MVYHRRNRRRLYRGYAQVMDNFSKTCAAIILLLSLAAGAVALDAKAEDYTPDEAAQEEQEQAPSIDTSSYVQVADPALYAKLDTLQESIDRLADALTPADAETDAEAPTEEQPAPDYTAQLSGISAQLADMAQQATAETAEDADPFQKPFEEYTTGETLQIAQPRCCAAIGILQGGGVTSIRRIAQGAGCAVLRICCCRQGILRLAYLLCQLFDAGFHLFCKLCQRRGSLFAHAGDAPSCVAVCIDWIAEAISFFAAKSALSA